MKHSPLLMIHRLFVLTVLVLVVGGVAVRCGARYREGRVPIDLKRLQDEAMIVFNDSQLQEGYYVPEREAYFIGRVSLGPLDERRYQHEELFPGYAISKNKEQFLNSARLDLLTSERVRQSEKYATIFTGSHNRSVAALLDLDAPSHPVLYISVQYMQ